MNAMSKQLFDIGTVAHNPVEVVSGYMGSSNQWGMSC